MSPVLKLVLGLVIVTGIATLIALIVLWPSQDGRDDAIAQGAQVGLGSQRYAATVSEVVEGPCSYSTADRREDCRLVTVIIDEGEFAGETFAFPEFNLRVDAIAPDLSMGDAVIAGYEPSTDFWFYADRDRRPSLVMLALIFAVIVIGLGRLRGLAALAGMALTLVVLIAFVAPAVLDGRDPLLVAVVAALAIAFVSLYLTHGFNPTTTVALAGTILSLGLTLALTTAFFAAARFTGLATEEALLLPFITGDLDLTGLLLGGAVLGTLGALDDVTVTQVATVAELHHRSPSLTRSDLMTSGIRVGRDHIASTVNTLLLAYAGASMPLLLLFAVSEQGLDKIANAELIALEIVRTLCGSIGLVAAVPVTTLLAALIAKPGSASPSDDAAEASRMAGAAAEPPDVERFKRAAPPVAPPVAPLAEPAAPLAEAQPQARPDASWDDFAPDDDLRDF